MDKLVIRSHLIKHLQQKPDSTQDAHFAYSISYPIRTSPTIMDKYLSNQPPLIIGLLRL